MGLDALRYRHDELRRALDIQRESVDVLRSRANVIVVAALAVSAFLGTDAATNTGTWGVLAGIVALGGTVALFGAILWPRKWGWFNRTDQLSAENLNHPGVTLEAVLTAGIDGMGRCAANNRPKVALLARLIFYEAIAAGATAAIWLVLAIP